MRYVSPEVLERLVPPWETPDCQLCGTPLLSRESGHLCTQCRELVNLTQSSDERISRMAVLRLRRLGASGGAD
jgi:uncharacterized Zn finger protein (UPF0148 family)